MLQSKDFPTYLTWLSQNLQRLIANLNLMKADCTSWDAQNMPNGQVAGPFPYGFGFLKIESWNNGKEVQGALSKLTDDSSDGLPVLQRHVNKLIAYSTSSVASAVGGLLGTAAVGGAGATVALNVGGVTTALKGAIGFLK
ncbi:secreted antigen 1 [Babesia caballi]|uniref:Secreted antigen 1 n=1 Tax=Babesia caballi TaxID=5871 RepID=A0AAV4LRS5_BABCB|nr:secreted antigen 1 [Babesia caballi]